MISLDEEQQEKTMKILETDRLLLRRLLPGDLDNLYALYSDPGDPALLSGWHADV